MSNSKCPQPEWDESYSDGKHTYGKDGICINCGETTMNLANKIANKCHSVGYFYDMGARDSQVISMSDVLTIAGAHAEELKVENEKLSLLLNENTTKWHTAELKLQKARTNERARIVTAIESLEYDGESGQITEVINKIESLITADQPKNCEGCEYCDANFECTADFDCFNHSHYQPKEK
jgi:hypothetical protein